MKATALQPRADASWAMSRGMAGTPTAVIDRAVEISQFWQKRQARSQPAVPKLSTRDPGSTWLSGFFSMGSTARPEQCP